jgi:hypothetical protein
MRDVRERPRLAAARVLAVVALLGIGIAIGSGLDDRGPKPSPQVESQLKRVKLLSGERAERLDRTGAELQRVQGALEQALRRARSLARANAGLRRNLRAVQRSLRRTQRAPRSRAR